MKKQTKSKETKPSAFIVSPKDKGRKSIKNSENIYLDNNEEFEIEIFNPLTECILADIRINGSSISKAGLVIKPGQRVYLDCFIDDKKKFIFQTYEVEDTKETKEATKNNGVMEVFFYKEEATSINNWPEKMREVVIRQYYPVYPPYWYPYYWTTNPYYGTTTTYNSQTGIINVNGSSSGTYNSNMGLNSTSTSTSTNNLYRSYSSNVESINDGSFNVSSLETGRVEKGSVSDQKFTEVNIDFDKNYIHHIVYKLLPSSTKPIEVKSKKSSNESLNAINVLKELLNLKESGIITDDEFNEKKKELLLRI